MPRQEGVRKGAQLSGGRSHEDRQRNAAEAHPAGGTEHVLELERAQTRVLLFLELAAAASAITRLQAVLADDASWLRRARTHRGDPAAPSATRVRVGPMASRHPGRRGGAGKGLSIQQNALSRSIATEVLR